MCIDKFYVSVTMSCSRSSLICFCDYHVQLHLTEGGLHADINGDGVLDHVQVC